MPWDIMRKSVDFLIGSEKSRLQLQFFGGEPLMLPFDLIRECITYAIENAEEKGKKMEIIITTNGVCLNTKMVDFFKQHEKNILIEVSLDGDRRAQNLNRPQSDKKRDSYSLLVKNFPLLVDSGVDTKISMVISPLTVDRLLENFNHLISIGFNKMFIMTSCGLDWTPKKLRILEENLRKLEDICFDKIMKKEIFLMNLRDWFPPLRMNTELIIDTDGSIYPACVSYLLPKEEDKKKYLLGNLNSLEGNIDYYEKRRMPNEKALYVAFEANNVLEYLENNKAAGMVMYEFVKRLNERLHREGIFMDR